VTAMASGCGPVVSLRSGKRLESPPRELQPRTSHLKADAGPCTWTGVGSARVVLVGFSPAGCTSIQIAATLKYE
jgi:hypothetical protein